jgi:hypothetical protein
MLHSRDWVAGSILGVSALLFGACAGSDGATPNEEPPQASDTELVAAPLCKRDSDCPSPLAPCRLCPDGVSSSCPAGVCLGGRCSVQWTECPSLIQCGGFAGLPCPRGFECVDDPRDDCSPCRGGADCGGICVELSCGSPSCDPTLICTQVLTCVDGKLYPTGCGPRNCDQPIGECAAEK